MCGLEKVIEPKKMKKGEIVKCVDENGKVSLYTLHKKMQNGNWIIKPRV